MTSIAHLASPIAMATTQFNWEACFDRVWIEARVSNVRPVPQLSWVVVIDDSGKRQLQMSWQLKE